MRLRNGSRDDGRSSRSLYVVAVVCFGPLALILLMGLLAVPVWVAMIAMHLTEPERFSNDVSGTIWDGVWPIVLVVCGLLGIVGLFRSLALLRHDASALSKSATRAMVIAGLTALLVFDLLVLVPGLFSEPMEESPVVGLLIYVVLPFFGAAYVLSATWKLLLEGAEQ
jgi:hypothetical protein